MFKPYELNDEFTKILLDIATSAGQMVLDIYNSIVQDPIQYKSDNSPLTAADLASHKFITEALNRNFPNIPIVSEEGPVDYNQKVVQSELFWLVDPIDGTKEFIARNGQFTICIALIDEGKPVLGIVHAPALGTTYYGGPKMGSYKIELDGTQRQIHVANSATNSIYGSRSHPSAETTEYIKENYNGYTVKEVGSQLKFVYVAEGLADAYPRFGHTMRLWDVAAGQAILEGAGGKLTRPDGSQINYNATDLFAGDFLASAS